MSKYDKDVQDVYAVKQLGDSIGYGHLMAIAHELWARYLENKGLPRRGAHCVVGYPMVKEQYQAEALNDPIYTIVVGKALADRKTESNSEFPNNCEHITEDGVTCAKYPACDDCLDNPLNKVKGSKRLLKGKTEPTISKMEQVDKDINVRSKDEPKTQTETQNSNLTFEKRTMRDCYNCKRYETEGECIECHYEPKDEPQTDCAWK